MSEAVRAATLFSGLSSQLNARAPGRRVEPRAPGCKSRLLRQTTEVTSQTLRIRFCNMVVHGLCCSGVLLSIERDNTRHLSSAWQQGQHTLGKGKMPLTPTSPSTADRRPLRSRATHCSRRRATGMGTGPRGPRHTRGPRTG